MEQNSILSFQAVGDEVLKGALCDLDNLLQLLYSKGFTDVFLQNPETEERVRASPTGEISSTQSDIALHIDTMSYVDIL